MKKIFLLLSFVVAVISVGSAVAMEIELSEMEPNLAAGTREVVFKCPIRQFELNSLERKEETQTDSEMIAKRQKRTNNVIDILKKNGKNVDLRIENSTPEQLLRILSLQKYPRKFMLPGIFYKIEFPLETLHIQSACSNYEYTKKIRYFCDMLEKEVVVPWRPILQNMLLNCETLKKITHESLVEHNKVYHFFRCGNLENNTESLKNYFKERHGDFLVSLVRKMHDQGKEAEILFSKKKPFQEQIIRPLGNGVTQTSSNKTDVTNILLKDEKD